MAWSQAGSTLHLRNTDSKRVPGEGKAVEQRQGKILGIGQALGCLSQSMESNGYFMILYDWDVKKYVRYGQNKRRLL